MKSATLSLKHVQQIYMNKNVYIYTYIYTGYTHAYIHNDISHTATLSCEHERKVHTMN